MLNYLNAHWSTDFDLVGDVLATFSVVELHPYSVGADAGMIEHGADLPDAVGPFVTGINDAGFHAEEYTAGKFKEK